MKDITKMTLKEKLGQLLIVGFNGYEYNDHLKKLVEEYKVGNIILFVRNIKDLPQLSQLNRDIHQQITKHTGIMPLITIDQEGGIVTRIQNGATFCPGNMTIAATDLNNSRVIGEIMGEELIRLGINMNLAPTLDVNNNPNNPVIGIRSYGDDPQVVSEYGINFIKGLQSKGIIATAKHFPGHGDVEVDSHLGLPIVDHDLQRLDEIELYPFKRAIAEGVDAIMSAHIFFKAYEDKQIPATISHKVMTKLLREKLGFKGLLVSDCMEMKAIDDLYTTPKGVALGIEAGLDMVFISHSIDKQIKALELIEQAVNEGRISMEAIDAKVSRILKYKGKTQPIINKHFLDNPQSLQYFEGSKNKEIAQQIVDESLTLVKGQRFMREGKTLLLATVPFATTIAEDKLDSRNILEAVRTEIPEIECLELPMREISLEILDIINQYDSVVVCSYNAHVFKKQAQMIQLINQRAKKLYVISTRNPYDYLSIGDIDNYACLYEYTPNAVRTIVKYLKTELNPKGKLPIKLARNFKVGASIYVGLNEYSYQDNVEYLYQLKKCGVEFVFMSAHMPEMDDEAIQDIQSLIDEAKKIDIKIILDVSKNSLAKIKIPNNLYSLRLDYGFSVDDIIELSKNDFYIELNASVIRADEINYLQDKVDFSKFRVSHNFYPKSYTGLSHEDVLTRNQYFKSLGFTVMAYLPSQNQKRPPIKDGLPTIEEHRFLDLQAALNDMALLMVDEICFGDAYCDEQELLTAVQFSRDELVIPIVVYEGISDIELQILQANHVNRQDANPYFVRSSYREKQQSITEFNTSSRLKKMITIDNHQFLRYQGEVGLMKQNLESDLRVNVVGIALISDFLLARIKPQQKFRFIIKGSKQWIKQ